MKRNKIKELKKINSNFYENIFNVYQEDGFYYYNLYNTVSIDTENIDPNLYTEHIFSIGDYWTLLSYKYYGTVNLWWILCVANNIQNPLDLPEVGTKLKILNSEVVSDIIQSIITNV